jgi:hypothetical protein
MLKRLILLAAALSCACAHPRPVLYPSEFYKAQSADKVKADIGECEGKARAFIKTNKSKLIAKRTGLGAAFGAFLGIIWGLFTGNVFRAAAESAAIGAAAGLGHGAYEAGAPGEVHKRFTDYCLAQKGYQPLGWK